MHQAYHCVKIIIDVNSYFHVVQSVHKTWNNPRVLIHLSAIALHLNTTKTGSGVEDLTTKETKHGSEDKKDKILFPQKAAAIVSINAAIAIGAFALKGR